MEDASDHFTLFSSRLKQFRYDESTLRILELLLSSSKDLKSLLHLRSTLIHFLRSQSLTALRQAAAKPIQLKLFTLYFFLRAFAFLHDLESCLSLRYEALVMRDSSVVSHPEFQVSYNEWMKFAEDAFDNAFYSVAAKACENAVLCFNRKGDASRENLSENMSIDRIQKLKDVAIILSSNHSVQAHATEYLKKKILIQKQSSFSKETECPASISFKNGIKLQNARNLMRLKKKNQ